MHLALHLFSLYQAPTAVHWLAGCEGFVLSSIFSNTRVFVGQIKLRDSRLTVVDRVY